jgi:uncharacterized protein
MYLVGADHPNKVLCVSALQRLSAQGRKLITDCEVFQEILHRYTFIRRPEAIQPAFDTLQGLVDEVFPLNYSTVQEAKDLCLRYNGLSARDAVHIATMTHWEVKEILSFDTGFDRFPGIRRICT